MTYKVKVFLTHKRFGDVTISRCQEIILNNATHGEAMEYAADITKNGMWVAASKIGNHNSLKTRTVTVNIYLSTKCIKHVNIEEEIPF